MYAIVRRGWEYSDEFFYHDPQNDSQVIAYRDMAQAEAKRLELEFKEFREVLAGEWGEYGLWEMAEDMDFANLSDLPEEELKARLEKLGITMDEECRMIAERPLTDDHLWELLSFVKTRFYEIRPVDAAAGQA